jgi:hypothetical protein
MFNRYRRSGICPSFVLVCPWWNFEKQDREILEAVVEDVDMDLTGICTREEDVGYCETRRRKFMRCEPCTGYLFATKALALHCLQDRGPIFAGSDVHNLLLRSIDFCSKLAASAFVNVHVYVVILRLLNYELLPSTSTTGSDSIGNSLRTDVRKRLDDIFVSLKSDCGGTREALNFLEAFQERAEARIARIGE